MITIVARWIILAEKIEFVKQELPALVAASRAEPGCNFYEPYFAEGGRLLIYERYRDEAALRAHRDSEHFVAIAREKLIPCLASREVDQFSS